jgi:hypothetical protein
MGPKEIKKIKKGKLVRGVMICDVVPKKIPNMAYQDFIEKFFTKNPTKQDFTWLSTELTMVYAISIAKFRILTPFLAVMCIFPMPTTFVVRVF